MASSFGWVDFSSEDRDRMSAVVQLFKEGETVDEMGLGVVRDAFANLLFPGTSTIQTRARYFFFVPWIYLRHERRKTPATEITARARKDEIDLIFALLENDDDQGVIGKESKQALQQLPSAIYWSGLGVLGIRRFPGSIDEYHRSFSTQWRAPERDGDDDENPALTRGAWHGKVPSPPDDFPKSADLALTRDEAEYLAEALHFRTPEPLLSLLIRKLGPAGQVDFPWLHPNAGDLAEPYATQLLHARNFSEAMYGASILYNLMCAEKRKKDDLVDKYRDYLDGWVDTMKERDRAFQTWDRDAFWRIADVENLKPTTKEFITTWLADIALSITRTSKAAESKRARDLVSAREWQIKKNRARLHDARALERWNGNSGAYQANYRWNRVRQIVADIRTGLGKKA